MSKGASVDTYVRPEGELGTAHFDFKVAHRRGEPSPPLILRGDSLSPLR
jgi:formamidopyrimidine-DNA glycosylase